MPRFIRILAALVALSTIAIFGVGSVLSSPAPTTVGPPPTDLPFSSVTIPTLKGQKVSGWLFHGTQGSGAVLLLHGIRGNRLEMLDRARFLGRLGYSVLLIDLPAHGESQAQHITFGRNESEGVKAAFAYLAHQLPGEKIGVVGVSLGAASFVFSAPDVAPSAVVLESMYPTINEAVADRLRLHIGAVAEPITPLLLWQLPIQLGITPEQLRPIDGLSSIHSPVLIASGSLDQHTTLAETKRLFSAANQPKELWVVEGAAHVDLHAFSRAAYETKISTFLAKYLRGA